MPSYHCHCRTCTRSYLSSHEIKSFFLTKDDVVTACDNLVEVSEEASKMKVSARVVQVAGTESIRMRHQLITYKCDDKLYIDSLNVCEAGKRVLSYSLRR